MRLVTFVFLFAALFVMGASPVAAAVMAAVAVVLADAFMFLLGAIIALTAIAFIAGYAGILFIILQIRNFIFGDPDRMVS